MLVLPSTSVVVLTVVIVTSVVVGVRLPIRSFSITVFVEVLLTEPVGTLKSVSGFAISGVLPTLIIAVVVAQAVTPDRVVHIL